MAVRLDTLDPSQRADCFFCRSPAAFRAREAAWVCGACGEANTPRRMAGFLDEPAPSVLHTPMQGAQSAAPWIRSQTQPNPFCSTCLRNHQIVAALLSDFDPPEDDAELAHQAAATYRAQLEASYPPVCPTCAPRVQQVIAANTRRAKTVMYASALQRHDRPAPVTASGTRPPALARACVALQIVPLVLTLVWLARLPRPTLGVISTQNLPLSILLATQYFFAVLAGTGGILRRFVASSAALVQTVLLLSPRALQLYHRWTSSDDPLHYGGHLSAQPVSAWHSDASNLPAILDWVLIVAAVIQLWALLWPIHGAPPRPDAKLTTHLPAPTAPVVPPAAPADPLLSSWGLSSDPPAPAPKDADDLMDWEPETTVRRRRPEPLVRPQTYFPPGTLQAQQTGLEDMFGRAVALQNAAPPEPGSGPGPGPAPRYPKLVLVAVAAAAVVLVAFVPAPPTRGKAG